MCTCTGVIIKVHQKLTNLSALLLVLMGEPVVGEPVVLVSLWQLKNTSNRLGGVGFNRYTSMYMRTCTGVVTKKHQKLTNLSAFVLVLMGELVVDETVVLNYLENVENRDQAICCNRHTLMYIDCRLTGKDANWHTQCLHEVGRYLLSYKRKEDFLESRSR